MTRCSACLDEDREGDQYCESCGVRLEPEGAEAPPQFARMDTEDEGSPDSSETVDEGLTEAMGEAERPPDSMETVDEGLTEAMGEAEGSSGSIDTGEEGSAHSMGAEEAGLADLTEPEDEGPTDWMDTEGERPAPPPKAGYLVFPDSTEQPIPPSQWLIGRADLAKFLSDPGKAHEISRGHITVFQEGDKFFIEDGKTMVQAKPSANKTWLVRGGSKILVTGTGRNELQDADEIDVAELVKLQFVAK